MCRYNADNSNIQSSSYQFGWQCQTNTFVHWWTSSWVWNNWSVWEEWPFTDLIITNGIVRQWTIATHFLKHLLSYTFTGTVACIYSLDIRETMAQCHFKTNTVLLQCNFIYITKLMYFTLYFNFTFWVPKQWHTLWMELHKHNYVHVFQYTHRACALIAIKPHPLTHPPKLSVCAYHSRCQWSPIHWSGTALTSILW